MIEKLWESGYIYANEKTETALMGYQIDMLWHEGEVEYRETFHGTDVKDVQVRALEFIVRLYKNKNQ